MIIADHSSTLRYTGLLLLPRVPATIMRAGELTIYTWGDALSSKAALKRLGSQLGKGQGFQEKNRFSFDMVES